MRCLIATSFQGLDGLKEELFRRFDCIYDPDVILPVEDYGDIEILIVNPNNLKFRLDEQALGAVSRLKIVLTISTGIAHIDVNYLKDREIKLLSLKDQTHLMKDITATAELAFLLLLSHARRFTSAIQEIAVKNWDWRPFEGKQINELKIGIVGYGRLGRLFESYCKGMGCNPIYYDPQAPGGVNSVVELFKICDVVSLHASFTPGMKALLDSEVLESALPSVHIINTARGELVDERALADFLKSHPSAHYSTDVIKNESAKEKSPIYNLWECSQQVTITPHIGGMTSGSRSRAYEIGVQSLISEVGK